MHLAFGEGNSMYSQKEVQSNAAAWMQRLDGSLHPALSTEDEIIKFDKRSRTWSFEEDDGTLDL